jgi:hypothetical protein
MSMTLLSPTGSQDRVQRSMAPRLGDPTGLRIGLLSNGKLNAELLLQETARCFVEHHRCTVATLVSKPHASKPAEPEQLRQLAGHVDFMITANGD